MKKIVGFKAARELLDRQAGASWRLTSRMQSSLLDIFGTEDPEMAVRSILSAVKNQGDSALFDFTRRLDRIELESMEVPATEIERAVRLVPTGVYSALEKACDRILSFHETQHSALLNAAGNLLPGTVVRIIEKAGMYIPGGTASYPSSVLMTVIPARVAGVKEIVACTPPAKDGKVPALTLAAAHLAGVDRLFAVGGAQAIAAMAYGTESIPRMDKICGPGNIFVMLAKKQVYGMVGIDGLEGPSEVIIIADEKADPGYCASDILAQAEHDALAQSVLITDSDDLAQAVLEQVDIQTRGLNRTTMITPSLEQNGLLVVVDNLGEAISLANAYAPEHLLLLVNKPEEYLNRIENAGCVFYGEKASVVMGDYVAGPSHALPTSGTARFGSALNIFDFVKFMNVVEVNDTMLSDAGQSAFAIATAEGFTAHAAAIKKRLDPTRFK